MDSCNSRMVHVRICNIKSLNWALLISVRPSLSTSRPHKCGCWMFRPNINNIPHDHWSPQMAHTDRHKINLWLSGYDIFVLRSNSMKFLEYVYQRSTISDDYIIVTSHVRRLKAPVARPFFNLFRPTTKKSMLKVVGPLWGEPPDELCILSTKDRQCGRRLHMTSSWRILKYVK